MRTLTVIVLMWLSMPVQAVQTLQHSDIFECEDMQDLAETIMKLRQTDYPVSKVFKTINESGDPDNHKRFMTSLTIEAYKRPSFRTEVNRDNAIARFKNDVFLECISVKKSSR